MKNFAVLLFFSYTSIASAGPVPSRLIAADSGQRIEMAVARINGVLCWTQQDKTNTITSFTAFTATSPVSITNFTPSGLELAVSTANLKFDDYSEYVTAISTPQYLSDKLDDLKPSQAKVVPVAQLKTEISKAGP